MIKAIMAGQEHPDWLADHAKGTLRGKRPQLRLVLRGRITDHHRLMLGELMEDLEFVEGKLKRIEKEIATKVDVDTLARLATVPGIDLITAWTLLAELGSDMSVFHSPKHAAAWAGLCAGNHEKRWQAPQQSLAQRQSLACAERLCAGQHGRLRAKRTATARFLLPQEKRASRAIRKGDRCHRIIACS